MIALLRPEFLDGPIASDDDSKRPNKDGWSFNLSSEGVAVCPVLKEGSHPGGVTLVDFIDEDGLFSMVFAPPLVASFDVEAAPISMKSPSLLQ